jgi:hypothetical protein
MSRYGYLMRRYGVFDKEIHGDLRRKYGVFNKKIRRFEEEILRFNE